MTLAGNIRRALASKCNTDFAAIFSFPRSRQTIALRGSRLSQAQIGQKLGVTRSHLNRVLNGKIRSLSLMRKLKPFLTQPKRKNQHA